MKNNNKLPLCINCKHYDNQMCYGHIYDAPPSLVDGQVRTIRVNNFASSERRHVGWLERLVGDKRCGAEGRYFEAK